MIDVALLNVQDAVGRIALGENDVGGLIRHDGFPRPCGTEKRSRVERRLLLDLHGPLSRIAAHLVCATPFPAIELVVGWNHDFAQSPRN